MSIDDHMKTLTSVPLDSCKGRQPEMWRIAELETIVGRPFPRDYISLIEKYGGTRFEQYVSFGRADVSVFFGLFAGEYFDLQVQLDTYKGRILQPLLPIACDSGGSIFCISCVTGEIFFWDHDAEVMGEPNSVNIKKLAGSLEEFVRGLAIDQ